MNIPKVSILIPTYNQPDPLRRTLNSLISQTFKNFEVIITDDSTDDNVGLVVTEYKDKLNLKFFKNKSRKGSPRNWNEAITKASGDYIKFLHHDDWFLNENGLEALVQALDEHNESIFAFCGSCTCDINQSVISYNSPKDNEIIKLQKNPKYLVPYNIIGSPSATIYRNRKNLYFDVNLKWVVDIDFYIQIMKINNNLCYIPERLVCCGSGIPGQITLECQNNKNLELYEWVYLYKKVNITFPTVTQIKFYCYLFKKYNVTRSNLLLTIGLEPPIPLFFKIIIASNLLYNYFSDIKMHIIRKIR